MHFPAKDAPSAITRDLVVISPIILLPHKNVALHGSRNQHVFAPDIALHIAVCADDEIAVGNRLSLDATVDSRRVLGVQRALYPRLLADNGVNLIPGHGCDRLCLAL